MAEGTDVPGEELVDGTEVLGVGLAEGTEVPGEGLAEGTEVPGEELVDGTEVLGVGLAGGREVSGEGLAEGTEVPGEGLAEGTEVPGEGLAEGTEVPGEGLAEGQKYLERYWKREQKYPERDLQRNRSTPRGAYFRVTFSTGQELIWAFEVRGRPLATLATSRPTTWLQAVRLLPSLFRPCLEHYVLLGKTDRWHFVSKIQHFERQVSCGGIFPHVLRYIRQPAILCHMTRLVKLLEPEFYI